MEILRHIAERAMYVGMCMESIGNSKSGGGKGSTGGKSVNQLKKQRKRTLNMLKARLERLKANGASADVIAQAEKGIKQVRLRANQYVHNAEKAVSEWRDGINKSRENDGLKPTNPKSDQYHRVSRNVYSKGKYGESREGQVGQFREDNGRGNHNGGTKENTKARRHNYYKRGGENGHYNRNAAVQNLKSGNESLAKGVKSGVKARFRTNEKGANARTYSNKTNYNNYTKTEQGQKSVDRFRRKQAKKMAKRK